MFLDLICVKMVGTGLWNILRFLWHSRSGYCRTLKKTRDFPNFAPLELISPLKYQTYVFTTDWWYKITHCLWEHLFNTGMSNKLFSVRNTVQKTKLTRVWSPSKSLLFDRLTWLNSSDRPCVKLPFIPSPSNTWYDVPFMLLSTSTFIPSVVLYSW